MTLSIDLFWSFRSPYSYLATPRLVEMEREYDLAVNVRPVYPLAVRSGEFFEQVNPLWIPYLMRDTYAYRRDARPALSLAAARSGRRRSADARGDAEPALHPSPHAARLRGGGSGTRIAVPERDQPHDLVRRTSTTGTRAIIWRKPRRAPGSISPNSTRRSRPIPTGTKPSSRKTRKRIRQAGHWGVPTMAFEGEPFFGQDRLDVAALAAEAEGA